MKWTGSIKKTYIELPDDLHGAMKSKAALLRKKIADVYIEAANRFLNCEPQNGTPPATVPDSVIQVLRTYAHDERFEECILALGRIWDGGDEEIQTAVGLNCRVLGRIASETSEG